MDDMLARAEPAEISHHQVLVVCSANVCRSPSIALSLQNALDAASGKQGDWRVDSAGTDARPGQPMCSRAASYAARMPGGVPFAATHRSQSLNRQLVEDAGLVLVASQAERAAVATLSPAARRRTFTVREAAMMMRRALDTHGRGVALTTTSADLLPTVVDLLHEQRGTLAISAGPAHFAARRRRADDKVLIDIGDVHQGQERRHKPVMEACASAARELAAGIGSIEVIASPSAGTGKGTLTGRAEDASSI